ncbi:hypothetical protein [Nocardia terpenica]|uniref:hypothetical protein n=1 Tax=Nocardia terpenica TaxID=455432 RepID=UPI002FE20772
MQNDSGPSLRGRIRRAGRILGAFLAVVVLATAGYLGYVAARRSQPVTLPTPTGPYQVGRTIFEWTDTARTDPLAPQPDTARSLSVWLWYPGAPEPGETTAPYLPGAWSGLHIGGPAGLGESGFGVVHPHAVPDAPVADGRFPIVVLEPGSGFAAPQYTALAEDLASHGYLVAGVTPTYSANLTVLHDRTVTASKAGLPSAFDNSDLHGPAAEQAAARLLSVWVADARFAAARLAALDASGRFAGHVNASAIAFLGHSFGGAAALEACRAEAACVGAADLDGTQYGEVVRAGLTKPMLLVASENSCVTGDCTGSADASGRAAARRLVAASTGPVWCYEIGGARHIDFSDYDAYYLAAPLRKLLALGTNGRGVTLTVVSAYLDAFLDQITRGTPQPLLTGESRPYREVRIQHTPGSETSPPR